MMLYFIVKVKNLLTGILLIVFLAEKLHIVNVKLPEGSGITGTAVATAATFWIQILLKVTDSIRFIMRKHGFPDMFNNVDDIIYCGTPSKIHLAF